MNGQNDDTHPLDVMFASFAYDSTSSAVKPRDADMNAITASAKTTAAVRREELKADGKNIAATVVARGEPLSVGNILIEYMFIPPNASTSSA